MRRMAKTKLGALVLVIGCSGPAPKAAPQPGSQAEAARPDPAPAPSAVMVEGAEPEIGRAHV